MLIISLSSIPPRFDYLGPTLHSLVQQRAPTDHILLYIPRTYRRFPDWDGRLPKVPLGVEIRRTDDDLGPATKVLAAARDFRGQNAEILFCDDDRRYPPNWAAGFLRTRRQQLDCCIANLGFQVNEITDSSTARPFHPQVRRSWRITDLDFQLRYLWRQFRAGRRWREVDAPWRRVYKKSGYIDIFEGCGGAMVRPDFFDDAAYDIPPVLWAVDDLWLSGTLARRGIPIWLRGNQFPPPETSAKEQEPLVKSVVDGADRASANAAAIAYFQQNHKVWL